MLDDAMKRLITTYRAGSVATVNDDGTPAVSPKATFVIVDDVTLAFGNIRSPGTLANISKRPAVEINFIDVLTRRAVRVAGTARIVAKAAAGETLAQAMRADWAEYIDHMSSYVEITITRAELILSPAYDLGYTESELRRANFDKLTRAT